jgi:hypothetical protein
MMAVEMQGATERRITCGEAETEARHRLGSPLMTPYRSRCDRTLFLDISYLIESAC